MDMALLITIIASIGGLAIGIFFGGLPMRTTAMTSRQNMLQQAIGIVSVGAVIVLILLKQDMASWAILIAMAAGVAIAKIPPVHRWLLSVFPVLVPAAKSSGTPAPGNTTRKRENRTKQQSGRGGKRT